MSDEQTSADEHAKKPAPKWLRQLVMAGISVLIVFLVFWSAQLRHEGTKRKEIARGIDAVATLLTAQMLERKPDKMRQALQQVADAAQYERLTVTDAQGVVIASTDRNAEGKTVSELAPGPQLAELKFVQGRYIIRRAIFLGEGNPIGGLEVSVAP